MDVPRASSYLDRRLIARAARAFGGFIGALLITLVVLSNSLSGGGDALALVAWALAFGIPAAFGLVLALGWRERRPGWPVAGLLAGCGSVAGVLFSTRYMTDEGAPLPVVPGYVLVCILVPVAGALLGWCVLRRRLARREVASTGQPT